MGRWQSGGYSPYTFTSNGATAATTLGSYTVGHPLMEGVTTLNAGFRILVTPAAGATAVALYSDGSQAVAVSPPTGTRQSA